MNYSVHGLMYGYFCLRALRCLPAWPLLPRSITALQISQMVAGVAVQAVALRYARDGGGCAIDVSNLVAGTAMYAAYLWLFVRFFASKYDAAGLGAVAACGAAVAVAAYVAGQ